MWVWEVLLAPVAERPVRHQKQRLVLVAGEEVAPRGALVQHVAQRAVVPGRRQTLRKHTAVERRHQVAGSTDRQQAVVGCLLGVQCQQALRCLGLRSYVA